MSGAGRFHAGVLVTLPGFFDPETCRQLRQAMDQGGEDPAEVLADGMQHLEQVRRAGSIEIAPASLVMVEQRLDEQREHISRSLSLPLAGREGAGFLRYRAGGFYRPHRDRGNLPSWPAAAARQVTVVVFLNEEFSGGVLRLWPEEGRPEGRPLRDTRRGRPSGRPVRDIGRGGRSGRPEPIDVVPATGLLVAFRAETLHEVTPVTSGVRDAIVDWFT